MADISLDDYAKQKGIIAPLRKRLGNKVTNPVGQAARKNIISLRQKPQQNQANRQNQGITKNKLASARIGLNLRLTQKQVQGKFDARQKLRNRGFKNNSADARQLIQGKAPAVVDARAHIQGRRDVKVQQPMTMNTVINRQINPLLTPPSIQPITTVMGIRRTVDVNQMLGNVTPSRTIMNPFSPHPVGMMNQQPQVILPGAAMAPALQNQIQFSPAGLTVTAKNTDSRPGLTPITFEDSPTKIRIRNDNFKSPTTSTVLKLPVKSQSDSDITQMSVNEVSPIQGYRLLVTNLHPSVSQDDIIELFGAVGALKRARLLKPGTADVVFVKREEAVAAIRKYHTRELDGQPMSVVMTTANIPAASKQSSATIPQRLSLGSQESKTSNIDPSVIHSALFRSADSSPQKVAFTVKI